MAIQTYDTWRESFFEHTTRAHQLECIKPKENYKVGPYTSYNL